METGEWGQVLKARRTAAGRTIAAVAADAGLSVPYIANLENGRGNPTLAALSALARALGGRLRVELADDAAPVPPELPATLPAFTRQPRFGAETALLAARTGQPEPAVRDRVVAAMAAVAAVHPGRSMTELDWHRVLDVIVLTTRVAQDPERR
ncbi:helix-turn-helix domain-containing protein [Catellatospora tritici]|uniref:helix-turn-helix domain-containing protein n=1 Tax=Catellatospora tritici TaxID=2851566 RepID=UPI001C2CF39F|nr:helix-turn-helix transcriptional regulator [Catellatospora tritici]MBV1850845.1 helix-turn-helix domain-containing protein [Catellatospora tritici]MBV1851098.1 helix-turn-helix domain-containing protein [Catellatospora tritici]